MLGYAAGVLTRPNSHWQRQMGDDDLTWLFDAVLGFLKSPGWALPVMSFIDDNCIVFDSAV